MNGPKYGGYIIGIDVGGTKTLFILQDGRGNTIYEETIPSVREIQVLKAFIDGSAARAGIDLDAVSAMAIGVPGRVNPVDGIVIDAPGLGWKNLNLVKELFRYYPFPCAVENDTTMALIAEAVIGKARQKSDFIFLAIGTGLGSAIMANGRIISGADYSAGEIGYCVFEDDIAPDFNNQTGKFGSLEKRLSGTGLDKIARTQGTTTKDLFSSYRKDGSPGASAVDAFILQLSATVANLVSILNPQMVVIGGGVSESLERFLDDIADHVAHFTPIKTEIVISGFYNRAGALGACQRAKMILKDEEPSVPDKEKTAAGKEKTAAGEEKRYRT